MAWSTVAAGTIASASTGNLVLTEPAGVAAGDLLVCFIGFADTVSIGLPSGWSSALLENNADVTVGATGKRGIQISYIIRGASAPSLTWTRSGSDVTRGLIVGYRSSAGGTITLGTNKSQVTQGTASTTLTLSGITTEANNGLLVFAGASGVNTSSSWSGWAAATDPTAASWTEQGDSATTAGADIRIGLASAVKATAGATGNFTATNGVSSLLSGGVVAFYEDTLGGGSTLTGDLSSSGTGAATLAGAATAAGALSSAGIATASFGLAADRAGALASTGAGAGSFVGASVVAGADGVLSSSGVATVAFAGASLSEAAFSVGGSASASFVGSGGSAVVATQRDGGDPFWRRSKVAYNPRHAVSMRALLDRLRAAHTPKQLEKAIKAAEAVKEEILAPIHRLETTEAAPSVRWDLALEELRQSEARQADVERTIATLRTLHQEALEQAAREAEEEEEAVMLLVA